MSYLYLLCKSFCYFFVYWISSPLLLLRLPPCGFVIPFIHTSLYLISPSPSRCAQNSLFFCSKLQVAYSLILSIWSYHYRLNVPVPSFRLNIILNSHLVSVFPFLSLRVHPATDLKNFISEFWRRLFCYTSIFPAVQNRGYRY